MPILVIQSSPFYPALLLNLPLIHSDMCKKSSSNRNDEDDDSRSSRAPFDSAILTFVAMSVLVITHWSENYGDANAPISQSFLSAWRSIKSGSFSLFSSNFFFSSEVCLQDRKILLLGIVQALFEASMYVFILEWTPALTEALSLSKLDKTDSKNPPIPHGRLTSNRNWSCDWETSLQGTFSPVTWWRWWWDRIPSNFSAAMPRLHLWWGTNRTVSIDFKSSLLDTLWQSPLSVCAFLFSCLKWPNRSFSSAIADFRFALRLRWQCSLPFSFSSFVLAFSGRKFVSFDLIEEFFSSADRRSMATLRSTYVPEEGRSLISLIRLTRNFLARATIMNYFRIPLNFIVVVILLKVTYRSKRFEPSINLSFRTFRSMWSSAAVFSF